MKGLVAYLQDVATSYSGSGAAAGVEVASSSEASFVSVTARKGDRVARVSVWETGRAEFAAEDAGGTSVPERLVVDGIEQLDSLLQRALWFAEGSGPRVRTGDRFRVERPLRVGVLTQWSAPFTGGHNTELAAGTELVALHDQVFGSDGVGFVGASEELEAEVVPAAEREAEKYAGYYVVIPLFDVDEALTFLGRP